MSPQYTPFETMVPATSAPLLLTPMPAAFGRCDATRGGLTGETAPGGHDAGEPACALWRQAVHDLRGKLGVVSNVTALLQTSSGHARRSELMAVLDRNVAGLGELLNGLADLARLDAQQERPAICGLNVAVALGQSCDNLRVLARSRGLTLEFKGPASLAAEGDPLLLSRIAQNLVLNALQYTRAGGVVLTCGPCDAAEAGHWYFEVGDAGPAAPGGPPPATASSGEGIGLSIVRRLCSLLGGAMAMQPCATAGRTTRVTLPLRYVSTLQVASPLPASGLASVAITH